MQLTSTGERILALANKFTEHDFEVRVHNSLTNECCVVLGTARAFPLAIHKGTTVETARLWKVHLITRRLAGQVCRN